MKPWKGLTLNPQPKPQTALLKQYFDRHILGQEGPSERSSSTNATWQLGGRSCVSLGFRVSGLGLTGLRV